MKVAARFLVPVFALSLVAVSCNSGSSGESATTTPTPSVPASSTTTSGVDAGTPGVAPGFAGIDLGSLADFGLRVGSRPDYVPAPPGEDSPTFELLGCRVVWPRLYVLDFEWTPTADVQLPLQAYLGWAFTSSDDIGSTTYDIVLDAGGRFSVPIDGRSNPRNPSEGVWTGQRSAFFESFTCYGGPFGDGIATGYSSLAAEPRIDPVDLSTDAPLGTLQELIGNVVPGDLSDPLLPLADLYARSVDLPIDRVYVDPDNTLEAIQVRVVATCVIVESHYENELRVLQARGCELEGFYEERYPSGFEDEAWLVRVGGGDSTGLEMVRIDGIEQFGEEGKYFDPDASLDAILGAKAVTEIARLAFKDGRVSVITGFDEDRPFLREIVVGLGGRNRHRVRGVDAWESCARWYVQPTDVGTFLLVVTSDPTWRIEALLNEWTPIEIAEASGFGVGLLELDEPLATPDIRAYEFDETPVTCLAEL